MATIGARRPGHRRRRGDARWLEGLRALFTRARAEGVATVLDADLGAREALSEILESTDFAIFSEPALKDYAPKLDFDAALAKVMALGPQHAGVTLGPKGYRWLDSAGGGNVPAFKVDVVDTTGAGDAFHGAFTLALVEGKPASECARFGCAAAALKCTRLGSRTGLPKRREIEAFLALHT